MEDVNTGEKVSLGQWREKGVDGAGRGPGRGAFRCEKCRYQMEQEDGKDAGAEQGRGAGEAAGEEAGAGKMEVDAPAATSEAGRNDQDMTDAPTQPQGDPYHVPPHLTPIAQLSHELLLHICDYLDATDLVLASRAYKKFSLLQMRVISLRELQCFVLKTGFKDCDLGVGVHVDRKRIESEFDLISEQAFGQLNVRRSVQGLDFEYWLPLPLAQKHWDRVKGKVGISLRTIARASGISGPLVNVLYTFMNDIVVRLSQATEEMDQPASRGRRYFGIANVETKSTLLHASEKAIESYFHLYHLLLCLAVEDPSIVTDGNETIKRFVAGQRDKKTVPNIGHLLIMLLISDVGLASSSTTPDPQQQQPTITLRELNKAIVTEAITRNVVWMLDARGRNMPELSYMEPDNVSEYRLAKTFEASKTSYRLLMFLNLMRKTVVASTPTQNPTLSNLLTSLFARHGAPPPNTATNLAASVRRIQAIDNFPYFLLEMNIGHRSPVDNSIQNIPGKIAFTSFLRDTVKASMKKGYSKWGLEQEDALRLRLVKESGVGIRAGTRSMAVFGGRYTFFPNEGGNRDGFGGGRGEGRGGRR